MTIPYILVHCFEFKHHDDYVKALQIALYFPDQQDESFDYCVLRERGMEVQACRHQESPYFVLSLDGELLDTNVSIETLVSADIRLILRLQGALKKDYLGFIPLLSDPAYQQLLRWPDGLMDPERFLQRKLSIVDNKTFAQWLLKAEVPIPCFIKTLNKGPRQELSLHHPFENEKALSPFKQGESPGVREYGLPLNEGVSFLFTSPNWYCPYREQTQCGTRSRVHIQDDFIVSDLMLIAQDGLSDNKNIEYRCFIVDGQVVSTSRVVDYKDIPVPQDAIAFAQAFAEQEKNYPLLYVLDVARTIKGYQVVELNPYESSGRYANNDPAAFIYAIAQLSAKSALSRRTPLSIAPPEPLTLNVQWEDD
jgi:hypothetical protein